MVLRSAVLFAVPAALIILSGCEDPKAVASFAKGAADTAGQGPPIFRDLADTCDTRHRINANVRAEWEPRASEPEPATCARFRAESQTLDADSDALKQYFDAINGLATGGTEPKEGKDAAGKPKGTKERIAEGHELVAASDLVKLAGQLAAERYQQSHLIRILQQADPDVAAITDALTQIVSNQYQQELKEERDDVGSAYLTFGKTDARNNPALLFLLNRAYDDDIALIDKRQHAAEAYVTALQKAREAHHQLAADASSHDIKKLYAEANTYGGQIEKLAEDVKAAR